VGCILAPLRGCHARVQNCGIRNGKNLSSKLWNDELDLAVDPSFIRAPSSALIGGKWEMFMTNVQAVPRVEIRTGKNLSYKLWDGAFQLSVIAKT
jgi:hypothetical protein